MKKNVIVCGLISGLIASVWMLWSIATSKADMDFENGMWYGYASMVLAFSLIFVGIKNFRDKYNQGVISFGKAFKIGFFISLIASTMYVGAWLIDYYFVIPDFGKVYSEHVIKEMRKSGASADEILKRTNEMAEFWEMYKNPFFNALISYTEILPVGTLISLIAALILKRKNVAGEAVS